MSQLPAERSTGPIPNVFIPCSHSHTKCKNRFLLQVQINSPSSFQRLFQEGHTSTIKTLLELGADLHARDKKGRSGKQSATLRYTAAALLSLGNSFVLNSGKAPEKCFSVTLISKAK